jgi:WD40 repeat protein
VTDINGDGRRVRALAFSPDDTQLAMGGEGPFITLWNPRDGKLIRVFAERPGKTFTLAFCGNDVLASGESDNMVRLWNPATGEQTATLSGHTGTISTMTFEPKQRHLVTGSFDASVRFWTLPEATVPESAFPTIATPQSSFGFIETF